MASNNVKKSIDLFINAKGAKATAAELRRDYRKLNNELNQLVPGTQAYIDKSKDLQKVSKRLDQHRKSIKGVGGAFGGIKSALSSTTASLFGVTAVIGGVIAAFKSALGIVKDYEEANSKLQAVLGDNLSILGDTEEQMEALTDQSKELGASTAFTATEVAGLQTELAKLGFPTEDILEMTEGVLNGAAAMGSELAPTAALVGSTLKAFGLDASETGRVVDVLSASTINSALDFEKLNASMSTIAPVASKLGFGLEDTTTLLGSLADAGFDASSAATATRNILLNLADSNGKLAKSLGAPVKDLPSLVAGLKKLEAEGTDLGEALQLTDKRSVAAFATFLDGTESIEKLSVALNDVDGVARRTAETMLDNLAGDTKIAQSAYEGAVLSFEDGSGVISQSLRGVVQTATGFLNFITDINNGALSFDDLWRSALNNVIRGFSQLLKPLQFVLGAVDKIAGTNIADSLNPPELELAITKVRALDDAFKNVDKAQLQSRESAKKVVAEYIKAGLSAEEAVKKYQKLAGIQQKTGEETEQTAEDVTDATVKQIETIASLNAELAERKKAQEELQIGSAEFIAVGNEIVAIEAKLAAVSGKTAKERSKNADKALKNLEKLRAGVDKFRIELENREAIEILKTDDEKELAKLEQSLDKKFAKEIAAAEKLATTKGDIGKQAQEQLDDLLLIKEKEFQAGKLKLQQESLKKQAAESRKENEAVLRTVQSIAEAEVILQQQKLDQINQNDFRARRDQEALVIQAIKDNIEAQREIELLALEQQREDDLISKDEFDARVAQVNAEFRQQELDLDTAQAAKQKALRQQVADAAISFVQNGIGTIAQFQQIAADKELAELDKKAKKEAEILQQRLDAGLISQEEFDAATAKLEEKKQKKEAKIKTKAAKDQQQAAIIQATIDAALAVIKAAGAAPPPANIPLIALAVAEGIAQIAIISSQPLPQFKGGGGTMKAIGADDGKSYNAKFSSDRSGGVMKGGPRIMLMNETEPEYFIPGHLLRNPMVADQVNIIEAIRTGRQFQQGGFTAETGNIDQTETPDIDQVEENAATSSDLAIKAELTAAVNNLNAILAKGIFIVMSDEDVDQITAKQLEIEEIKGDVE